MREWSVEMQRQSNKQTNEYIDHIPNGACISICIWYHNEWSLISLGFSENWINESSPEKKTKTKANPIDFKIIVVSIFKRIPFCLCCVLGVFSVQMPNKTVVLAVDFVYYFSLVCCLPFDVAKAEVKMRATTTTSTTTSYQLIVECIYS